MVEDPGRLKEKERSEFTYTVTEEEVRKHQAKIQEEILQWIQETATFFYEMQTPEEKTRKFDYKPHKRPHPDLLRKD